MRRLVAVALVALVAGVGWVAAGRLRRGYSDTKGARVVRYTLRSRLLGRELGETAVLPRGGARGRPLLVLLHGRGSSPGSWLSDPFFAGLAALGRRAPVVVLLRGGDHSYYHDRDDGPWGSMILREAVPDAVARFHTVRGKVAIGGISMGGYGALHAAATSPARFCAVGGHSAALWTSGGATASGAFDDAEDYARHDVYASAREGAFDRLRVWIDGGADDPFRDADAAFVATLRRRHVRVAYHVWPGGHEGSYWRAHVGAYLRFYADALARC